MDVACRNSVVKFWFVGACYVLALLMAGMVGVDNMMVAAVTVYKSSFSKQNEPFHVRGQATSSFDASLPDGFDSRIPFSSLEGLPRRAFSKFVDKAQL